MYKKSFLSGGCFCACWFSLTRGQLNSFNWLRLSGSVCLSVCLTGSLSIRLSLCLFATSTVHLSVSLSVCSFVFLSLWLSVYLSSLFGPPSISLSASLTVRSSLRLSVCSFLSPSLCLSVYLSSLSVCLSGTSTVHFPHATDTKCNAW